MRDWYDFQSCKNKVPRWWRSYFRFAFLEFRTDVLPTPITSVDPRVQSFRISGDLTPFRLLGSRVIFRRSAVLWFRHSAVPLFQLLGSPMVSPYWESSIILEPFKLYELWSACSDFDFPRQRHNKYHSNLHTDNLRSTSLYTSTTLVWLPFCWCLVATRLRLVRQQETR